MPRAKKNRVAKAVVSSPSLFTNQGNLPARVSLRLVQEDDWLPFILQAAQTCPRRHMIPGGVVFISIIILSTLCSNLFGWRIAALWPGFAFALVATCLVTSCYLLRRCLFGCLLLVVIGSTGWGRFTECESLAHCSRTSSRGWTGVRELLGCPLCSLRAWNLKPEHSLCSDFS